MKAKVNQVTIEVMQDDILTLPVAALVTVTDPNLALAPELEKKVGADVVAQTRAIGWADIGTAAVTDGGALKNVEKIFHAVGPRWGEESARAKLALVTWQCLSLAEEHQLKSIALPAISTGALGYPPENCAKTMLEQIIDFTFENLRFLKTVMVCVDDMPNALQIFETEFQQQLEALREAGEGQVLQV
jgi:O-acetyl-ADP-ribose deacetylase